MAKQEVAVKKDHAVSDEIPDFMREDVGKGTENVTSVEMPRIKLIQKISPELDQYNDLRAGEFFHTILEQSLGTELRVCPIYTDERYILWRPQHDGGGILARADDGQHWSPPNATFDVKPIKDNPTVVQWSTRPTVAASRLAEWGSSNPSNPDSPPAATKMFNVVCSFPDFPEIGPAVVTLQRSSVTIGKKLMGKLKITRAPSFGLIFKMQAVNDTNKAGQIFLNYQFTGDGKVMDEAFYRSNRDFYEMCKAQGVAIRDIEGLQTEDGETSTNSGAAEPGPEGAPKY